MQTRFLASVMAAACCIGGTAACGGVLRTVGIAPLDSTRAVAVAEQNMCGHTVASADTSCVLIGVSRRDGQYVVTLDRNPPAGHDRLNVTITGENSVKVEQVPRPSSR